MYPMIVTSLLAYWRNLFFTISIFCTKFFSFRFRLCARVQRLEKDWNKIIKKKPENPTETRRKKKQKLKGCDDGRPASTNTHSLSLWSFTPSTPQLWPLSTWTCLSCLFSSWFGSSSLCHCWLFFWELFLLFTEEKIPICCFKPSPASFFVNKLRLRQHRRIGDVAVQRPHGDVQRPADRFAYRYQQPSLPSRTICSFNSGRRVTTPAIFRCHCRPVDDIFDQQLEPFRLFGHPIPLCPAPRRQRREVSFDFLCISTPVEEQVNICALRVWGLCDMPPCVVMQYITRSLSSGEEAQYWSPHPSACGRCDSLSHYSPPRPVFSSRGALPSILSGRIDTCVSWLSLRSLSLYIDID